jgi:hypothetical protein
MTTASTYRNCKFALEIFTRASFWAAGGGASGGQWFFASLAHSGGEFCATPNSQGDAQTVAPLPQNPPPPYTRLYVRQRTIDPLTPLDRGRFILRPECLHGKSARAVWFPHTAKKPRLFLVAGQRERRPTEGACPRGPQTTPRGRGGAPTTSRLAHLHLDGNPVILDGAQATIGLQLFQCGIELTQ